MSITFSGLQGFQPLQVHEYKLLHTTSCINLSSILLNLLLRSRTLNYNNKQMTLSQLEFKTQLTHYNFT